MSSSSASNKPSTSQLDSKAAESTPLDDISVANYLANHPDFFKRNPGVIVDMELPHHSGSAVSLVERQVAILRERGIETRHKLGQLIQAAEQNDTLFNKTQQLILRLLNADSLQAIIKLTEKHIAQDFDVECFQLLLLGDDSMVEKSPAYIKLKSPATDTIGPLIENSQSYCGSLRDNENEIIFGNKATQVGSAALASRDITGPELSSLSLVIAVGAADPEHYNSKTGTLFLDYLADVLQALLSKQLS